jgi:transposase
LMVIRVDSGSFLLEGIREESWRHSLGICRWASALAAWVASKSVGAGCRSLT